MVFYTIKKCKIVPKDCLLTIKQPTNHTKIITFDEKENYTVDHSMIFYDLTNFEYNFFEQSVFIGCENKNAIVHNFMKFSVLQVKFSKC